MPPSVLTDAVPLIEIWRGGALESVHCGHAVVADSRGVVAEWGSGDALAFPRSSVKMIQALPLALSTAASDLAPRRLALACASHQAAKIHVHEVTTWLDEMGLSEADLRCGVQAPRDREVKFDMIRAHGCPSQIHNNCSGKHAGFLMLSKALGGGPEYLELDHPVQRQVLETFADLTQETPPQIAIDGCSAPNPNLSIAGVAQAMAWFATASVRSDLRSKAAARLVDAMIAYPEYVAGEGRACTALMRAAPGVAVKTGAEGYFIAIVPHKGLGVALKIADGATRAAEAAMAQILIHLDVLDPAAQALVGQPIRNWRGLETGHIQAAKGFADD